MRCSCPVCSTYMVHSESRFLGCVCPQCGARCRNCLGTDTVVSRENLEKLSQWFSPQDGQEQEDGQRGQTRLEAMEEADREARGKL